MDIKDIIKNEPFAKVETEIGELNLFSITTGRHREMLGELGGDLSKCSPQDFIRILIKYVCVPTNELIEGKFLPKNPSLSTAQVEKLPDKDLEKIAKTYIEKNDYLYLETVKESDKEGGNIIHFKKGEVKYPRIEDEKYVDYLHRLSVIEYEEMKKTLESFAKPFAKFKHFSDTLNQNIKNTFILGDSLRGTFAGTSKVPPFEVHSRNYDSALKSIAQAAAEKEERHLKPLKEMANKFDVLIDSSAKAADFLIEMNRLQTGIAEELKESGDKAVKFSKINLKLNSVVIGLTAIALIFSIITYFLNKHDSSVENLQNIKQVKEIATQLVTVGEGISNNYKNNEQTILKLLENNGNSFKDSKDRLDSLIVIQAEMLNELKRQREENKTIFKELKEVNNKVASILENGKALPNTKMKADD